MSAIQDAKDAMFLDTAIERDLDRLGSMFYVARPELLGTDDDIYRNLIQLLAFSPKQVLKIVYDLMGVLFGTQASLATPWAIYEVFVNEIIVEIPLALTTASLPTGTYLHGLGGDGNGYTTGSNTQFFVVGDDFTQAASSFAGLSLQVYVGGVLTSFAIVSVTYDPITRINTITTAPALPTNTSGQTWRVLIPSTVSYTGDYLVQDATVNSSTTNFNPVIIYGDGLIDIFLDLMDLIVKASGIKVRIERI